MTISRVARRYAEAIILGLPEGLSREEFFRDVSDLKTSLSQSRELRNFFESPIIPVDKKIGIVNELFADRCSPYVLSVLSFLIEKTRERKIVEIVDALIELKRIQDGILFATVSSATALNGEQRGTLAGALAAVSKMTVETEYRVDPKLLGGVVVRMNDVMYDGSVVHQLGELRERFLVGM